MDFACTRLSTRRMCLIAVYADRGRTRDVINRVEDALSRTTIIPIRPSSLLAGKKSFKERPSLCRLLLDLGDRWRWRGLNRRVVALLQARRKILQLAVFYSHGINVPDWLFFQRSRGQYCRIVARRGLRGEGVNGRGGESAREIGCGWPRKPGAPPASRICRNRSTRCCRHSMVQSDENPPMRCHRGTDAHRNNHDLTGRDTGSNSARDDVAMARRASQPVSRRAD